LLPLSIDSLVSILSAAVEYSGYAGAFYCFFRGVAERASLQWTRWTYWTEWTPDRQTPDITVSTLSTLSTTVHSVHCTGSLWTHVFDGLGGKGKPAQR